jgi:predicted dehydrogenase
MREYHRPLPEFVDRFGPAYKAELAAFIACCRAGSAFPTCHTDGLRAQEVIDAGMKAMVREEQGVAVRPA